jgi:hypothetical protein
VEQSLNDFRFDLNEEEKYFSRRTCIPKETMTIPDNFFTSMRPSPTQRAPPRRL